MRDLGRRADRTTTRRSSRAWACAIFGCALLGSTSVRAAPPLDEREGVRLACSSPAAIALATAARRRADASAEAATVLTNPRLRAEHQRDLGRDRENETIAGLAFPVPLSGRRGLLHQAAKERGRQANAELRAGLLDTALAFRASFARAVLDAERARIARAQQKSLDALSQRIAGLARAGETAGYDQERQQQQAALHAQELESLEAQAEASRLELEEWTDQPVSVGAASLPELAGGRQLGATWTRAPRGSTDPRLAAAQAAARSGELEARSARRRGFPEPELFVGYRRTSADAAPTGHGIALSIELPLPMFDHGQGDAAHAEAEAAQARAIAAGLRRRNAARLRAALQRLARLERSIERTERTASAAEALEGRTLRLFAAGEAALTDVLDALRGVGAARLARVELAEQLVAARLDVMRAVGSQLDSELDRACSGSGRGRP